MSSESPIRVYLIPGMFGFGRLADYDYFLHMREAIETLYRERGLRVVVESIPTPPTASLRRRAMVVSEAIWASAKDDDGPIHLVGHSTGGLDARLLLSPTARLPGLEHQPSLWSSRVGSMISISTPHYGTPLAGFFATVSGTRLLYALSLLTVSTLSFGRPGLAALSRIVAALGAVDELLDLNVKLLDEATELTLRFVDRKGRTQVERWLRGIREDQGGIVQLTPEAMDLFNVTAEDSEQIRYGCIVSAATPPSELSFAQRLRSPYAALSSTVYTTLYGLTARAHPHYPYPKPQAELATLLTRRTGAPCDRRSNDGVVPTQSMLWGELVWAGRADHLDLVGHFKDGFEPRVHVDWLESGAGFTREAFGGMMEAIVEHQLQK